jgi:hypothetical protein
MIRNPTPVMMSRKTVDSGSTERNTEFTHLYKLKKGDCHRLKSFLLYLEEYGGANEKRGQDHSRANGASQRF